MTEAVHPSIQQIVDAIKTHYLININSLTPLHLGADTTASIYKAESTNQSVYFVKLKQGHQDTSVMVQTFLDDADIKQIIPPIKTIHGRMAHQMNHCSLSVYPFIHGQNGFHRELSQNQWITLGKAMRQIHDLDVPSSLQNHLRQETFSPRGRDFVRSLYAPAHPVKADDEIAQKFRAFMDEKASIINQLVDRAEHLAHTLQNQTHRFVLCHADLHGGNVLMDDKGGIFIVDWDDATMAPIERDLMFIGGGVGNVWNKPHEIKAFYQGYGRVAVNQDLLIYYRHERIVEDIADFSQQFLFPDTHTQDRDQAYHHFVAQFDPQGVVDIALNMNEV